MEPSANWSVKHSLDDVVLALTEKEEGGSFHDECEVFIAPYAVSGTVLRSLVPSQSVCLHLQSTERVMGGWTVHRRHLLNSKEPIKSCLLRNSKKATLRTA